MGWFQCSRGRSLSHTDDSPRRCRRRDALATTVENVLAEKYGNPFSLETLAFSIAHGRPLRGGHVPSRFPFLIGVLTGSVRNDLEG